MCFGEGRHLNQAFPLLARFGQSGKDFPFYPPLAKLASIKGLTSAQTGLVLFQTIHEPLSDLSDTRDDDTR